MNSKNATLFKFTVCVLVVSILLLTAVFWLDKKPDNGLSNLNNAEQLWSSKRANSYKMELGLNGLHVNKKLSVVVKNGLVVETQEICPMPKDICAKYADMDSVDALFRRAHLGKEDTLPISKIVFDADYFYPKKIFYSAGYVDAQYELEVFSFAPINQ